MSVDSNASLTVEQLLQVEAVCDRFEHDMEQGRARKIQSYLVDQASG